MPSGLPEGFIGSEACNPCHSGLFQKYRSVAMSRSLYRPSRETAPEFFASKKTFIHLKSNYHYEMSERAGRFYQKRFVLDSRGRRTRVHEEEITYVLGSGNHARTYLRHHSDGRITQLPVSWYAEAKSWGMSPGYDVEWHQDFSREILHDCVFCHASYPRLAPLTASNEKLFPYELQLGIGCERCHGPGADHVNAAKTGAPAKTIESSIFNPKRATKQTQRDLCYQCHFASGTRFSRDRIYRPDRPVFSYRPGEPLSSAVINLDYSEKDRPIDEFKIAHQGYRLEQSTCFKESRGEMTCMTCHDPHEATRGSEKVGFFRTKCLQCHTQDVCKERKIARLRAGDDCTSCHMWNRRPQDAVRTLFTDHKIQKIKPKRDFLAPMVETNPLGADEMELVVYKSQRTSLPEERYFLGMAYLQSPPDQPAAPMPHQKNKGINALEEFLRITEKSPNRIRYSAYLSRAYYVLGESYRQMSQLDLALNAYNKSIEYDSSFADGYVNLGALLAERARPKDAQLTFEKAISLNPWDAMAYRNLGSLYAWEGAIQQATLLFHQSLKTDPDNSGAYYYLGKALFMTESYKDAVSAYESALDREPRNAEIYWDSAAALMKLGRIEQALQYVQTGLRYSPGHPQGLELLSSIQQRSNR
ncbi:MAG: tetratricopeptide repeat protein [Acidobacteria bacterium]|nr:tetratricopeptide repeat protein [Acidobacteriota bacterium]